MIALFVVACIAAVLFWVLSLAEVIAMTFFAPKAFKLGIKAPTMITSWRANIAWNPNKREFETDNGKFKAISEDTIVGRHKFRISLLLTPFPLKGAFHFHNGFCSATWRIPLAPVCFFGSFLFGWTVNFIAAPSRDANGSLILADLIIGWIAMSVLVIVSAIVERWRARTVTSELRAYLAEHTI